MAFIHRLGRFVAVLCLDFLLVQVSARDIPSNVREFYNSLKLDGILGCSNKLATGFWSSDGGSNSFSYCGDRLSDSGIVYIKGSGSVFANMDINCDGAPGGSANDGRCSSSTNT